MNKIITALFCLFILYPSYTFGQQLIVEPSNEKSTYTESNGIATIVIHSDVSNLSIINENGDEMTKPDNSTYIIYIDVNSDLEKYGSCWRKIFLNSPYTDEFIIETSEITPNQSLHYYVSLPASFPFTISAEYIYSKTTKHGIRVSFGKTLGGYLSYKWGDYLKYGADIAEVQTDYNLEHANMLGYIRNSYTGGLRLGVVNNYKSNIPFGLYALIGGGYGEYGRQWQNPTEVDRNIYFYSDYIKGFEGEVALQGVIGNWLTFSVGADVIMGNGKVTADYMLGIGVNLNMKKIRKKK